MTREFDRRARSRLETTMFPESLDYTGVPVSEMVVIPAAVSFAREYIATYHYTRTMPDSTLHAFSGWLGDALAGIITYGMGVGRNQYSAILPDIQNGEYVELTRLWSPDGMPTNTESKLIAESLKLLPDEIKLVMSFADTAHNHTGTIYQATNFYYCGKTSSGKMLLSYNGEQKTTRLIGIYRMRHPEYADMTNEEIMEAHGLKEVSGSQKHRYVYLRGGKLERRGNYRLMKHLVEEYPKGG